MTKSTNEMGRTEWICNYCGKTNSDKSKIKTHVQTHLHLEHYCPHCSKPAKNPEALKTHIRTFHKMFQCPEKYTSTPTFCCYPFLRSCLMPLLLDVDDLILQNMRKSLDEEGKILWSCAFCGKSARHKNSIKAHTQTHLSVEQNCTVCGKPSKNKESLRIHMRLYHKEMGNQYPNYQCFHFAKSSHIPGFPEPENLMLELFEEGQKFFKCRVCGKVGKRKDNLLAHIETHLPTKPQTCDHCGKLFKTKNSLTSHVSRWHRHDK